MDYDKKPSHATVPLNTPPCPPLLVLISVCLYLRPSSFDKSIGCRSLGNNVATLPELCPGKKLVGNRVNCYTCTFPSLPHLHHS